MVPNRLYCSLEVEVSEHRRVLLCQSHESRQGFEGPGHIEFSRSEMLQKEIFIKVNATDVDVVSF